MGLVTKNTFNNDLGQKIRIVLFRIGMFGIEINPMMIGAHTNMSLAEKTIA